MMLFWFLWYFSSTNILIINHTVEIALNISMSSIKNVSSFYYLSHVWT